MRTYEALTGEADPWDEPVRYLILHKVRGKPAFDVAFPFRFGEEDGWLIPTSGHRAYPQRAWALDDLADVSDVDRYDQHPRPCNFAEVSNDLRDHYSVTATPKVELTLESLGIKGIEIKRRRL